MIDRETRLKAEEIYGRKADQMSELERRGAALAIVALKQVANLEAELSLFHDGSGAFGVGGFEAEPVALVEVIDDADPVSLILEVATSPAVVAILKGDDDG